MTLEPYQEQAVAWLCRRDKAAVVAPAGSGKTCICAAAIARVLSQKDRDGSKVSVGWVCNTLEQKQQAKKALDLFPIIKENCRIQIECAAANTDWRPCDVLVVDECFPAGTLVDETPIEELQVGDRVKSYNHTTGRIEKRRIVRLFKSVPSSIVTVTVSGRKLHCTAGHPIWSGSEYVPASKLTKGAMVSSLITHDNLHRMRQASRAKDKTRAECGSVRAEHILLSPVSQGEAQTHFFGDDVEDQPKACFIKNEESKSNAPCGSEGKSLSHFESYAASADYSRGQWPPSDNAGNEASDSFGMDHFNGSSNPNEARDWIPNLLQDRRGESSPEDRNRSGRNKSLFVGKTETGPEERSVVKSVRVDCVTFQKPTSDGTFGGLCPGGFVYNFETEQNHNYFANGILVHNCHHAATAPGWRSQIESFNGPLWGFTATPPERDENPDEYEVFRNLFHEVYEVDRKDVGRLAHAKVVLLKETDPDAGYRIDQFIANTLPIRQRQLANSGMPDGQIYATVAWNAVIEEGIVNNYNRSMAAILTAKRHVNAGDSVLVLANQVEHCKAIAEAIPHARACWAGMGRPKRSRALESFSTGIVKCLVATSLADEGLDIPRANILVMLSGGRNRAKTEQRTGRVLREFSGKDHGIIYDFEDSFHRLMNKHAERRQEKYIELGYEIIN